MRENNKTIIRHNQRGGVSKLRRSWLLTIVIALGAGVLLAPSAMAWTTDLRTRGEATTFYADIANVPAIERSELLLAAEDFNRRLAAGTLELTNEIIDSEYRSLLRIPGTNIIGLVSVPKLNVTLPIYHGTTDDVLRVGAGHWYSSALPVGGADTHSIIVAHSGLANAEMFTRLTALNYGDEFTISVLGEQLTYRIVETQVILPEEVEKVEIKPGRDLVSLLTCYPVGVNTHRLLVTGERVQNAPRVTHAAISFFEFPGLPYWSLFWLFPVIAGNILGRKYLDTKKKQPPWAFNALFGQDSIYPLTVMPTPALNMAPPAAPATTPNPIELSAEPMTRRQRRELSGLQPA